jgi:hypothetical protein
MRGIPWFNFPAFDRATELLRAAGHQVCNPAERDRDKHGDRVNNSPTGDLADLDPDLKFDLRETLAWDLAWIAEHADGIAVLPGWENSKGANAEVALARALGLLVAPVEDYLSPVIVNEPRQEHKPEMPSMADFDALVGTFGSAPATDYAGALRVEPEQVTGAKRNGRLSRRIEVPLDERSARVEEPVDVRLHDVSLLEKLQPIQTGEVRTVSVTGGEKGMKVQRYDLLPNGPLAQLATLYGRGAEKYAERNWERGYEWSKSFAAAERHLRAHWAGEDIDPEMGVPHVICAAWHCFAMAQFLSDPGRYGQFDDRPKE